MLPAIYFVSGKPNSAGRSLKKNSIFQEAVSKNSLLATSGVFTSPDQIAGMINVHEIAFGLVSD